MQILKERRKATKRRKRKSRRILIILIQLNPSLKETTPRK
jgi:hypothetical protein